MSKSNLFALFVIAITIIIAMDVKVNDYSQVETVANSGNVSILAAASDDENVDSKIIDFDAGEFENGDTVDVAEQVEPVKIETSINFGLIHQVGFQNVTLQMVPFNGILMEKIDMRDFKSIPVIRQNLLEDNRRVVAEFNEFHAESSLLANEIYLLIKEKAADSIDAGVNETNEFGEKSLYINYGGEKNNAFLVVKISQSVYALRYEKTLHNYIKTLLQLLI